MSARPVVHVGHDVSPELAHAIEELGVNVVVNGWGPPAPVTKVIVVLSPKGGSGKTAIVSNLALAISQRQPGRVVAVDLDVQFGDLATAMALQPERTLAELARVNEINATTAKLFLTPYDDLYVLSGAGSPVDADAVTAEHVSTVLPLLAQEFSYVLVDTPAGLDERTLSAIDCATDLLVVSSLDVTSIKSLRKALDALDRLGVAAARTFVLKRADSRVGLTASDAEEVLGMKAAVQIPSCREIPMSLNIGTPVIKSEPKSLAAKQLQMLSQVLAPVADPSKDKKGWRR